MTDTAMITELCEKYAMLPRGCRVLCAVSGGRDSMCLLHWLKENREALGIELFAAHYDHSLRGEDSVSDCSFTREKCAQWGIPFFTEKGDVAAYAAENGLGTEDAARKLRYEFLEKCADENGCDRIATAHNADDNAETMLMNLMRGCGLNGMCGIPPVRGRIIRPLLGTSRDAINAYVRENGIPFVEDATNSGDAYLRNRIRHHVMPELKAISSGFPEAAFRASQLMQEDESCLDEMAQSFIDNNYVNHSLPCKAFSELPDAVSARVLRRICGRALSLVHVAAIRGISCGAGQASADVPGMRVMRGGGRLYFGVSDIKLGDYVLTPGETVTVPEAGLELKTELIESFDGKVYSKFKILDFNYHSVCDTITLTSRREGDRIRLAGRGCTKSLKDLFAERGLSPTERSLTPVLRDGSGIIAVVGFGVAERCTAVAGDKVLRIIIKNIETGENYRYEKRH